MNNNYSYDDPDYTYTDPRTGVLRNLVPTSDAKVLAFAESGAVTQRLRELAETPLKIKNSETLLEIHRHLFQDIYEWAGKPRTVEISKGGRQFFPTSHFPTAFAHINKLLADYNALADAEKQQLSQKLAELLDVINFLHPFREGNGRTQREFLRLLALQKNWRLNLNPPDNADIYLRYMRGAINGSVPELATLINELLKPL
jgi:cell filamentation protein